MSTTIRNTDILFNDGTTQSTAYVPNIYLGLGQTWQNVTGSRDFGTTYTNSTGKPIFVAVSSATYNYSSLVAHVNGTQVLSSQVSWAAGANAAQASISIIIPPGATYYFTVSYGGNYGGGSATWFELR